jgi:hypothetical protein
MTIMMSDPRVYWVNVDGDRMELSENELNSPKEFQKKCLRELNKRPDLIKDKDWGIIVNGLTAEATFADVPPELTIRGQFLEKLEEFCTSRVRAMAQEELVLGKPWTAKGVTSFKIQGLMDFLKRKITVMKVKKEDGTYASVRVWRVPAFDTTDVDLGMEDGDDHTEIPF